MSRPDLNQKKENHVLWNSIAVAGLFFLFLYNFYEEKEIESNKGVSIGRVTSVTCGQDAEITYTFFYNEKRYDIREFGCGGVIENEFYEINFKLSNPKVSRIVRNKRKNPMILVQNGIEIRGEIEKVSDLKNYCDLYVNYKYLKKNYSVRTRIHKDSLPCGSVRNCKNAIIPIKISSYYPDLNNLYFESYDRSSIRAKYSK